MFDSSHPLKSPLFDYYAPLGNSYRGLLSIPHSGMTIPEVFTPYLSGDERAYLEDVDFKVNELVDIPALQRAGVAVLVAHVHRICVDLNRAEGQCVLFWKENTQGRRLVMKDPTAQETERFIETFHRPYYEILKSALLDLEKRKTGRVSMVDLHSMPSTPTAYHMKQNPNQKTRRPQFCISNRKGETCQPDFIEFFKQDLERKGHESSLNDPYVGGFVTEYVGKFRTNNIQIEINRSVYMDEATKLLVSEKATALRGVLTDTLIKGFEKFDS